MKTFPSNDSLVAIKFIFQQGRQHFTFPKQGVIQKNVELHKILAGYLNMYGSKLTSPQHSVILLK